MGSDNGRGDMRRYSSVDCLRHLDAAKARISDYGIVDFTPDKPTLSYYPFRDWRSGWSRILERANRWWVSLSRDFKCPKCESHAVQLQYERLEGLGMMLVEVIRCRCVRCEYRWGEPVSNEKEQRNEAARQRIERLKAKGVG